VTIDGQEYEPKFYWTFAEYPNWEPVFHWYGEEQEEPTKGESKKMTKLSKAQEKYLALLEAVEAEKQCVQTAQERLNAANGLLAAAQKRVADFEGKHVGETLLKPYKVPARLSSITVTMGGLCYSSDSTAPRTFNG
jgi:hypothetical protein